MMNINKEDQWLLTEKYAGEKSPAYIVDCERLRNGEPLAYVIGWKDFLGARIDLSENVLIPREETEWWVNEVLASERFIAVCTGGAAKPLRVLDIFAGSGCIGVSVLRACENAHMTFVDSEDAALRQSKKNCERNAVRHERYEVLTSNIFSNISGTFDVIFANPPYVAAVTARSRLGEGVREHEPHAALFGGDDGLSIISPFLRDVSRFLAPCGVLYMEYDDTQKNAIEEMVAERGTLDPVFKKDQYGAWRWMEVVLRGNRE